jgi:peptide alpha-N-acetyltransferase
MTTTIEGSVESPSLPKLHYIQYDPDKEAQYLTAIRELISKDLSEPYSIYVYRYFLYQWADLCYMVCIYSVKE